MPAIITPERECRRLVSADVKHRKSESGPGVVVGYAAKFGVVSHDLGGFVEVIRPGAFARAIADKQDATFLWMHDRRTVMARVSNGTLVLKEDGVGLVIEANLCDTTDSRNLVARLERRDVSQMSFTFTECRGSWDFSKPMACRFLEDVDLWDISAVDEGQYPDTEISARARAIAQAGPPGVPVALQRQRLRLAAAHD